MSSAEIREIVGGMGLEVNTEINGGCVKFEKSVRHLHVNNWYMDLISNWI